MLLLDEMLSPSIALELTRSGCDAVASAARLDLRGSTDAELLEFAARENRIMVTDNIRDFVLLSTTWVSLGRLHPGIIMISSKTFPMNRTRSGLIAAALIGRCTGRDWPQAGQFDFL